jgi:hypothetical protein
MPFTGSHPAAVLPLIGTPLPSSALVIGSMSPDIPYYLPLTTAGWPTHTAVGIVGIDLLLGGSAWLLWHGLLSAPALDHAPRGLRERLAGQVETGLSRRLRSRREVVLSVVALIVGAATHVLWDEFTHPGRWGTQHIGALRTDWGGLAGYRWAQYGSGLFGAVVIAGWLVRWWQRTAPTPVEETPRSRWPWLSLLVIGGVTGVVAAVTSPSVQVGAFRGATRGGGAIAAAGLLLAAGWQIRRRQRSAA